MITLNKYINYSVMTKAEFAQCIDAYADAKASGNKYLVQKMIGELEAALNEIFGGAVDEAPAPSDSSEASGEY
jgi:hypothetical protein